MSTTTAPLPRTRREPTPRWAWPKLRELWENRALLYFLVWRDLKVRYRQTVIGALWAILQPLLTMVIFTLVFDRLARVPSDGVPYPVFSYAALLPWALFAHGLNSGATSLVLSANMVKKLYFPRLALPVSTVLAGTVDFALAFLVLVAMMVFYRLAPTANVLWLPFFLLLALVTSLGMSLWLSALNVLYRDVQHTLPFLTQAWFFLTPIAYPSSLLAEPWKTLYGLNPMAGVVEGFRWALLGTDPAPGPMLIVSSLVALALFVSGAFFFRRMEQSFADML